MLQRIVAVAHDGNRQLRAIGLPTQPSLAHGLAMASAYDDSARRFESFFTARLRDAASVPVDDVATFRERYNTFRIVAVHWSDGMNADFGAAQTLDTAHALEKLMRADGDCYWMQPD